MSIERKYYRDDDMAQIILSENMRLEPPILRGRYLEYQDNCITSRTHRVGLMGWRIRLLSGQLFLSRRIEDHANGQSFPLLYWQFE